MSVSLDPVVARKLEEFGRRRFRLIVARGLCAGVATFLICVAIVAAIDWYWLLSDRTRWALSAAIYLPVIVVIWTTSLRRILRRPLREEIASQVEMTEPQLRENLLSAVELATDDPSSLHDSPVFRSLLQGKVAEQMTRIEVPTLLPLKLVARWMAVAGVVVAIAAVLLLSSDHRYRQLAARAILPGANIARVSRVNVEILQPTPRSLMMAEDETVAVVASVTGGSFDEVTLETFTEKQGAVRQVMRGRTEAEFTSNIHVMEESVEYRILAGDAVTARFRIEARPRPRVTAFLKTFVYPAYALLPDKTVTENHGDLLVLEGTKTEMQVELDQQVSAAELRIDPSESDEMITIPLTPVADSQNGLQWKATVPVDAAAIYKVHLVSKETGFENLFSPKYEIRPQPDLIPRAGFVDQKETTLLLPPNDIVALKAMAEDDLPLVKLEQHVSVNGLDWIALPLDAKPDAETEGRNLTAEWQWDLQNHKLKTGDQVMTKLVATDRKGNIGESIPLRVIVAAQDFDPERHTMMERKTEFIDELAKFSELFLEQKVTALEVIERLRKPEQTEEQATQDQLTLTDLASKQREQAEKILANILAVEKDMAAGADAYDLDLIGRVVARIQREYSSVPAFALKARQHTEDVNRRNGDLDVIKQTFERTADDAKMIHEHYQVLATHNFVTAVANDMDALLRQQKLVVDSPTQTWERLQRQETLVLNQIKGIEQLIRDQRKRLPKYLEGQLNEMIRWTETSRDRLQDSMESSEKLEQLKTVSKELHRQLLDRQRFDVVDGNLSNRIVHAWRDLDIRAGNLYLPIEQLARAIQQENQLTAQAATSQDSAAGQKILDQAERFVAEIDLKHRRSLDQLRIRKELTQARKDGDAQYVADAGLAHRAVVSLLNQHRQVSPQESPIATRLLEVAPAYRILEAGHELTIVRDALDELTNLERWGSQDLQARIEHPRVWDLVQRGFELASQRLREAGVKNEIVGAFDQTRWTAEARDAARKITERRWKREAMISAGHDLVQIREQLAAVIKTIEPVMEDARNVIRRYSPTIPQMAAQTAEQIRELEEATTETADVVEQKSNDPQNPETAQQLEELEQRQESINQQIADLTEALVEDANAQDLLEESQRERARDADDSIAMIQDPATKMNEAMEKAQEQAAPEQQAKELAQAAEQQEKAAKALELVAEHFDQLDKGLDVADTRAELREAEKELGIVELLDKQYDTSEELVEMAEKETSELISELEAELQKNPAMQKALAEISQTALEDARNALEYAAEDDKQLQRANEQADQEFQAKKRDLVQDLREMAADASQLSGALVAQASQSAAQGKTPEAQQKLAETQQKLNEAAAKANSAREELLLSELAQTVQETKATLTQATETLKQAKEKTQAGKDEKIHADDKAREAQKVDSEKRRQQFHEQQKKAAADVAKRADDAQKRAEQAVQAAEKNLAAADTRLQQAQTRSNEKPDNAGLKNNVAQEQVRQAAEQIKVAAAKAVLQDAQQKSQQANQRSEEVKNKPLPALDAQNPATQLADQYADEAMKAAEQLNKKADEAIAAANFGNELSPPKSSLTQAETQQGEITEDVASAAEDVSRAARHERRLNNPTVAEPLQNVANSIQQVARNESNAAEQQLKAAATEAEQAEANALANPQNNQPQPNGQALKAQQDVAKAETAINQQAGNLSAVVDPLLAAAAAAEAAAQESGEPAQAAAAGNPADGANANATAAADGAPAADGSNGNNESKGNGLAAAAELTPEEMARGEQLARTLDELDRLQAEAAVAAQANADADQAALAAQRNAAQLDTLAQAARAQQAAQAAARLRNQQETLMALGLGGAQSSDSTSTEPRVADFEVTPVNRNDGKNWGKLRSQSAEDLTKGKSEVVSEEYRKSVETYFRVLAERAKKK
jgi:hypothetical protein